MLPLLRRPHAAHTHTPMSQTSNTNGKWLLTCCVFVFFSIKKNVSGLLANCFFFFSRRSENSETSNRILLYCVRCRPIYSTVLCKCSVLHQFTGSLKFNSMTQNTAVDIMHRVQHLRRIIRRILLAVIIYTHHTCIIIQQYCIIRSTYYSYILRRNTDTKYK